MCLICGLRVVFACGAFCEERPVNSILEKSWEFPLTLFQHGFGVGIHVVLRHITVEGNAIA